MIVVPPVAVVLLALADRADSIGMTTMRSPALSANEWWLILGSLLIGGGSAFEEFTRTLAARGKSGTAGNPLPP